MKIFVDSDSSSVKETVIEVAVERALDVVIVTSVDHYSLKDYPENVFFVYVDRGVGAADSKIVQLARERGSLNCTRLRLSFLGLAKRGVGFTSAGLLVYERKY